MSRSASYWTAQGLALLIAALGMRASTTPEPVARTAPDSVFSAERALRHDSVLAVRPHPIGSEDNARVRAYLVAQLQAMGLEPELQEVTAVGTRYPVYGHVINVLARLPGRIPGGKAVLIAAHYDGVGASPAAGDDGAGASAILETLRALRAGPPLEHDVIALISDGEEAGLLGAAAFVREHPWAKDVDAIIDFEARGTNGRSLMFETGAGNLDVARVLRTLPDVTAGSLMVTIYRLLPNDTDLSELSLLGKPALNFAFVHGVERYHTAHDDLAHLDAGSVQHHGMHMLALARAFGNGPLPRPATGDAIFFDVPFLGLVVYPEAWGIVIALVGVALVVLLLRRSASEPQWGRGIALGVAGMLVATIAGAWIAPRVGAALDAMHATLAWDGHPSWRWVYALAIECLSLALAASAWAAARRWASAATLHTGALIVWTLLGVITALKLPGTSYLFTWPAVAIVFAALVDRGPSPSRSALVARGGATAVACALLVPVIYSTGAYTLPLNGPGGIALGALVPMLAWLLAPHLETIANEQRWGLAGTFMATSLMLFAIGAATIRRTADLPFTANLTYVTSADADSAWLTAPLAAGRNPFFVPGVFGATPRALPPMIKSDSAMRWIYNASGSTLGMLARSVPRTLTDMPNAEIVSDSVTGDRRRVTVHFVAPHGTLLHLVTGAPFVRVTAVDGRTVDTTRYRRAPRTLTLPFVAPPDSGFTAALELPRDSVLTLRLAAMSSGLPAMSGVSIPARPVDVVPIQNGDATVRFRRVALPRRE